MHQEVPAVSQDLSSASQEALAVDQNHDHKQDSTMKEVEEMTTLGGDGEEKRETLEEEMRRRRYSPRMTLPVQRKEEKDRRRDDEAEGAARRVSPKFQGGRGGKVSMNAKEEKMYLFDLA